MADDNGAVSFLSLLGQQMSASRQANALATNIAGGASPPPPGILGRLLGFGGDDQSAGAPIQLQGAVPAQAPTFTTAPGLAAAASNAPATVDPNPGGGTLGSLIGAPGAIPTPQQPFTPSPQPFAPAPATLPSFAAGAGVPGGASPNAQAALAFYQSKGLSPLAASALVGGFQNESGAGLNTAALNRGDGTDGSNSIGIGQWNGDRARGLQSFAAANGLNPSDINTQLEYSWAELNGPERATLSALQQAQNPAQATAAALGYERPAGWSAQNPYGAKTFGKRLQSTLSVANAFNAPFDGSPVGPNPSAFTPQQGSGLPAMVASGMGPQLSRATGFAASAPQQMPIAGGNGAPQTGPTLAYAPSAASAPAAAAINNAAPADPSDPPVTLPGFKGTWTRASAAATESDDSPEVADVQQAQNKARMAALAPQGSPGTALAVTPPASAAPGGLASMPGMNGLPAVSPNMIRQLLSDPDTKDVGLALWEKFATRAPVDLQRFEGKNGVVYSFNPQTGAVGRLVDASDQTPSYSPQVVNGRLLAFNKNNATAIDATPAGMPSGYRPMTADERQAFGVGAGQAAYMGPDGKPAGFGGGGAGGNSFTVAAQQRQQLMQQQGRDLSDPQVQDYIATGKFTREGSLSPTAMRAIQDSDKGLDSLYHARDVLANLQGINDQTPGGASVGWEQTAQRNLPSFAVPQRVTDDAVNATDFDKTIQEQMLPRLKEYFGGRPAFAADQQMLKITPTTAMSPAERAPLLANMAGRVNQLIAQEEARNTNLRAGTYYKPGGSGLQPNPPPGAQQAQPNPSSQGGPVQIRTSADYGKLRSGDRYIDPNGTPRIKQ